MRSPDDYDYELTPDEIMDADRLEQKLDEFLDKHPDGFRYDVREHHNTTQRTWAEIQRRYREARWSAEFDRHGHFLTIHKTV